MFGFSAVLVSKENDILLPKIQKEILLHISQSKSNHLKEIHLHTLKHEQRRYICNAILEQKVPIRSIIVLTDKTQITGYKHRDFNKEKYKLFNYIARYLLERVSWLVRDNQATVQIVFSNRKQLEGKRIDKYIHLLKQDKEAKIEWSVINDKIKIYNQNQRAGLQFADIFATSCRRYAFEGDKYGVETSYLKTLYPFLYKHNNKLE